MKDKKQNIFWDEAKKKKHDMKFAKNTPQI